LHFLQGSLDTITIYLYIIALPFQYTLELMMKLVSGLYKKLLVAMATIISAPRASQVHLVVGLNQPYNVFGKQKSR